jgi:organic hydroperoxide reductase OsmC/OhrA
MSATTTTSPETRIRRKTFTCTTGVQWTGKRAGDLTTADRPHLHVGEEGSWTPEDLFVASVNACTMSTFMTLAEKLQIAVLSYSSEAAGTLEWVDGHYQFTDVVLRPRVVVADAADLAQVRSALEEAHRNCLIGNSIRGVVVLEPAIGYAGDD